MRNQRETKELMDQLPKHYLIADEIKQHPDKDNKTIVLVIDKEKKTADVVMPSGASLEVNNEIQGMSKQRIQKALEREGIETVRFYNPDGALGYRPDDSYFADKQVDIARLKKLVVRTSIHIRCQSCCRASQGCWVQSSTDDTRRQKPLGIVYQARGDRTDIAYIQTRQTSTSSLVH